MVKCDRSFKMLRIVSIQISDPKQLDINCRHTTDWPASTHGLRLGSESPRFGEKGRSKTQSYSLKFQKKKRLQGHRRKQYAFLPCRHLDFESVVTVQNEDFKGNLEDPFWRSLNAKTWPGNAIHIALIFTAKLVQCIHRKANGAATNAMNAELTEVTWNKSVFPRCRVQAKTQL